MRVRRFRSAVLVPALLSFVVGCPTAPTPDGSDSPPDQQAGDQALPDFAVTDANPNSARYGENVSPRDYLGEVSAWYFGHST